MKLVAFTLTMPRVASWDGKWSGEGKLYVVIRRVTDETSQRFLQRTSYRYRWEDGWAAQVECQVVDFRRAAALRKKSAGFCGYEWMIDSILAYNKILVDPPVRINTSSEALR